MILIDRNVNEVHRLYGINHFIQKYGIVTDTEKRIKIGIFYNDIPHDHDYDFNIEIFRNDIREDIVGYLETDTNNVPLFEKPIKFDIGGTPLVMFSNSDSEYPCVIFNSDTILIGFDVFNEIGHILSGHLEFIWNSNLTESKELAKIPVVDHYEKILFDCLRFACDKMEVKLIHNPFWPDGKNFALCMTHDVDRVCKTYQYFTHFIKHLKNSDYSGAMNQIKSVLEKLRGNEPYWNFEDIINIENKLNAKSTFFFLNEKGRPSLTSLRTWMLFTGRYKISNPEIVKTIKQLYKHGWEIGVHGSYESYKDKIRLGNEKKELEEITGEQIHGIRQHHLNLEIPQTWRLQEELGFKFDSTLGFKDDIGFRGGTCFPFHLFDSESGKTLKLLEIPLIIMDSALLSKENVWEECSEIIDLVANLGGVLTLLWHQRVFNETEFPEWSKIYGRLIALGEERGAWITNAGEIERWWDFR